MGKLDFENLNGEQWVQLLCEHPEYADQCDWEKLNMDDWFENLKSNIRFFQKICHNSKKKHPYTSKIICYVSGNVSQTFQELCRIYSVKFFH